MTKTAAVFSEDGQEDLESAVRYLLHRVRKPLELARAPYAKELCVALDEANAVRALRRLVDLALPGASYSEMRLRSLIVRMDFDDELSVQAAADDLQVSRRQLQRFRSEAVGLIAARLAGVLRGATGIARNESTQASPVTVAFPARDREVSRDADEAAFGSEHAAFVDARDRSDALKMYTIARNLRRIANARELGLAVRCYAEGLLRSGRPYQALESAEWAAQLAQEDGDSAGFAAATLIRARARLFEGDAGTALRLATNAQASLVSSNAVWVDAEIVAANSLLALGREWSFPKPVTPSRTQEMEFGLLAARFRAKVLDWSAAFEIAKPILQEAGQSGYTGIVATAAALLSEYFRDGGDLDGCRRMREKALRAALRAQDFLIASRLLLDAAHPTPNWPDGQVADVLYERAQLIVPQIVNDDERQAAGVRDLLQELCRAACDPFRPAKHVESSAERVRKSESAFAGYARQAMPTLSAMLELTLLAFTPRSFWLGEHPDLKKALAAMDAVFSECRPKGLLVGYPTREDAPKQAIAKTA